MAAFGLKLEAATRTPGRRLQASRAREPAGCRQKAAGASAPPPRCGATGLRDPRRHTPSRRGYSDPGSSGGWHLVGPAAVPTRARVRQGRTRRTVPRGIDTPRGGGQTLPGPYTNGVPGAAGVRHSKVANRWPDAFLVEATWAVRLFSSPPWFQPFCGVYALLCVRRPQPALSRCNGMYTHSAHHIPWWAMGPERMPHIKVGPSLTPKG